MRAIDQRSSIWVGRENETAEYLRPKAELYDLRVAHSAVLRRDQYAEMCVWAILMGFDVMARDCARATAHWAHVMERYEASITGFEVVR